MRALIVVAAIAVMSVSVADAGARADRASAVPHKLVALWTRKITPADLHGATWPPAGIYKLDFHANGSVDFYEPDLKQVDYTEKFSATAAGRLVVGPTPMCALRAVYAWKVAGNKLTLSAKSDPSCSLRVDIYGGTWTRR